MLNTILLNTIFHPGRQSRRLLNRTAAATLCLVALLLVWHAPLAFAQENPLSNVTTTPPPPPPKTPEDSKPVIEGADRVAAEGTARRRDARIRVDVNWCWFRPPSPTR